MLRRFLIALCLLMPVAANAQSSKSTIVSTINTDFADNTTGAITAALLRTVTTTMVSSYVDWLTCTSQGGIAYWNASASPACLTPGVSGQVLATYGTPAWENLATKLSAGSGITITGTITPTLAVSPNAVLDTYGTTQGGVLYRGSGGWSFLAPGTAGQVLSTYGTPAWESLATKLSAGSGVIISGTITPTIATSASTILDTLGTAQGGVVYRGASGWAFLSPGTSGQVLTTGGAANNPSYTTVSGTGTVQSVSCGALTSCSVSPITVSGTISVSPGTVTGNAGSYVLSISPTVQTPIISGWQVFNGATSGTSTVKATAITSAGTLFQLPANNGTAGWRVSTDGSGVLSYQPPGGYSNFCLTGINANSANTDNPLTITIPTGFSKYRITTIPFYNPSISLTTARAGVFTGAGATGTTIVSDTALSALTTNTADTSGNLMGPTVNGSGTTFFTDTTVYIRISTAQGSAATVDACLQTLWLK